METFRNPARFVGQQITNPDPFIMSYLGVYYCYATDEAGVRVSTSTDLVNWEYQGMAFSVQGRRAFWAPCVIYRNGQFFMYVSDRPIGEEDTHLQRLRVARAQEPLGPFESIRTMRDTFAIDADVIVDEAGDAHMFYASNEFTGLSLDHPGTGVVRDRLTDLTHLEGDPTPVVVPTLPEEVFAANRFGDGRDWHTIEGSAYFTRRGFAYMTYSGNAFERPEYFIGYSRAARRESLENLEWTKVPDDHTFAPLMRRSGAVEGTGHNSVILAPNLVDWWIVYHGRDAGQELLPGVEQRVMRLDRLYFDGDDLWADGPTADERSVPGRPTREVRGVQEVSGELPLAESVGPYVAEVYMRAQRTDSGARYAIVPLQGATDADRYVVWFDAGSRTITARRQSGNIWQDIASAPLRDFDMTCWQPIRIERQLATIIVRRGEEILLQFPHDYGTALAAVSALTQYTDAEVGYFRLSEHVDWYPAQGDAVASVLEADQPTEVTEKGVWAEHAELRFRHPLETGTDLTVDLWLPSSTSEVHVVVPGQEEVIYFGADSSRATARIRVSDSTRPLNIRLARAAIAGLTVTRSHS